MNIAIWWWTAVLATVALTWAVRAYAVRSGLMDLPNARSSHDAPTPRGGGLAIVLVVCAGMALHWLVAQSVPRDEAATVAAGLLVAAVGYLDDRRGLPAGLRFAVHLAAMVLVVTGLPALPLLPLAGRLVDAGWIMGVLAVIGGVWSINLFNFMDGTDGIAASQALFVCGAGALLMRAGGAESGDIAWPALVAAASAGFLVLNRPRARIFMGDVGSGFLGLAIAAAALRTSTTAYVNLWTWLVLHALFVADATVTLLRRLARSERVFQAHRQHAYQWLARRCGSHRPVWLGFAATNLFVLLPLAWCTLHWPGAAPWIVAGTYGVAVVGMALAGAGRAESVAHAPARPTSGDRQV